MVKQVETLTLTRTMGLVPFTKNDILPPKLFEGIKDVSNLFINVGSSLSPGWFLGDSLKDAKIFYDKARNTGGFNDMLDSLVYKERARRCAATSSYYCLQGYQQRAVIMPALAASMQALPIETMIEDEFLTNSYLDDARARLLESVLNKDVRKALLEKIRGGSVSFPGDDDKKNALVGKIESSGLPHEVIDALLDESGNGEKLDPDLVDKAWVPPGLLNQEYLANLARGLRNILRKTLFNDHEDLVVSAFRDYTCGRGDDQQRVMDEAAGDLAGELEGLATSWFRGMSTRMTGRVKEINALILGKRPNAKPWGTHYLDDLIKAILVEHAIGASNEPASCWDNGKVVDLAAWQNARLAWRGKQMSMLENAIAIVDPAEAIACALPAVDAMLDPGTAVGALFRSRVIPGFGGRIPLPENVEAVVHAKAIAVIFNRVGRAAWAAVEAVARDILDDITADPKQHVRVPRIKHAHLPVGIDNGEVYECTVEIDSASGLVARMNVKISLKRHHSFNFRVKNASLLRVNEMLARGFGIQKGTITRKTPGGGLLLHLPFQQDCIIKTNNPFVSHDSDEETPGDDERTVNIVRVAGVDLGLIHLAWISIADCLARRAADGYLVRLDEKVPDIARCVIDQEQLLGNRTGWFPASWLGNAGSQVNQDQASGSSRDKPNVPNWKGSLAQLFRRVHALLQEKAILVELHGSTKRAKKTVAWKKLGRDVKRCWKRIRSIHGELAKQVATRIVAACEHFGVDVLRFEDLSWSRQSPKRIAGYWLSTWQVHWFHSRIQEHAALLARAAGISVEKINAAGTSKRCSYCGRKGDRSGKSFTCKACGRSIDSDLNAARNVAVAPLARGRNSFLPAFNVQGGRRLQSRMMCINTIPRG